MGKYFLEGDRNSYVMMSQAGVKQYLYPRRWSHNAIWDSTAGPDGKFYYALASEIATNNYVRFCTYDYHTHTVEELFKIEDVILPQDRTIRASKFHTSISFMPDDRIIMTTHTTDKSPRHPTWMPYAFYHHLWEGFAGGNIVVYDRKTKKAENLGIPVPHESIYGATYDPAHNALFFLGMMRGHLYRYGLDDKRVTDLGKVTENYAFRLRIGPDGNLYGASRTGWLYKVDTGTLKITDMNFQFKHEPYQYSTRYNNISVAHTGPDGRMYFSIMYSKSIYALDVKTSKVEDMGHFLPAENYNRDENRNSVFGMDFDSKGVMWYAVSALNNYEDNIEYGVPPSLFSWDITRGGKPEWAGLIATPERGGAWMSELSISKKDDVLYMANSNHALDGPGVIGIDLNVFKPTISDMREPITDGYYDPANEEYVKDCTFIRGQEKLMEENPTKVQLESLPPVLLWRALAPDSIDDSAVKGLYFEADGALCGVCGEGGKYFFTIRDGKLESLVPAAKADDVKIKRALDKGFDMPEVNGDMPCYPGRQYKRGITTAVRLGDGSVLAASLDGMLALIKDGGVYALGPAAVNGPVHAMAVTPDGQKVYGVVGDEDDITTLFSFDARGGLRQLGFIENGTPRDINDVFFCSVVRSCAISPDGKYLALGADERIGTVVIYKI